jgi:hypothetical protein
LPRTEPIRNWSTLFDTGHAASQHAAQDGSKNGAQNGAKNGQARGADAVQRGVELGYRVIDEYLKQGARAAGAFSNPAKSFAPSADDLPRMTERMMQYASDFTSLWFDAMNVMLQTGRAGASPFAPNAAPSPANGEAKTNGTSRDPAEARALLRHVLELSASRPVEVTVTLDSLPGAVRVHTLQSSGKGNGIHGVEANLTEAGGPLRIKLAVPDALPKGRYSGAILDAQSGEPCGRITVNVQGR